MKQPAMARGRCSKAVRTILRGARNRLVEGCILRISMVMWYSGNVSVGTLYSGCILGWAGYRKTVIYGLMTTATRAFQMEHSHVRRRPHRIT